MILDTLQLIPAFIWKFSSFQVYPVSISSIACSTLILKVLKRYTSPNLYVIFVHVMYLNKNKTKIRDALFSFLLILLMLLKSWG